MVYPYHAWYDIKLNHTLLKHFVSASSSSSYSTKNGASVDLFSHCSLLGSLHPQLSSLLSKQKKKKHESVHYPDCSCSVGLSIAYIITRCERPAPVFKQDSEILGLPGGTSSKEPACQSRRHKRLRLDPWVGKIPWRRAWQPTQVLSLIFLDLQLRVYYKGHT